MFPFQLVMFDFDGLLVDSERMHYLAYKQMCANHGLNLLWDFSSYCLLAHRTSDGVQRALYEEHPVMHTWADWTELYAEKSRLLKAMYDSGEVVLQPGAQELLEWLDAKNIKRCVVTHSAHALVSAVRERHPILSTIPHWITREHYRNPKPLPDCYHTAMEQLLVPGGKAIGFEDTPRGLRALLASGATAALIPQCDYPELPELLNLGAKVFSSLHSVMTFFLDSDSLQAK